MVAGAFDDGRRARVPNGEALAGTACAEELAACRAVEHGVAEQDRITDIVGRRNDDDPPAAHSLADIVVRLADELEFHSGGEKPTEALTGRPFEPGAQATGRRAAPEPACDLDAEACTDPAIPVRDRVAQHYALVSER